MTELEKCQHGLLYSTAFPEREPAHLACADLCWEYNHTRPSDTALREQLLRRLFGKLGIEPYVEPNIFCGFGSNIEAGDYFYANNNCIFVDPGKITFGDHVFIGPCCGFYTAHHPIDSRLRNQMLEYARPIKVGNDVWFGGHCCVLPGVTIGSDVVIGAGSVVVHDIPDHVIAVGNPCRPISDTRCKQGQYHDEAADPNLDLPLYCVWILVGKISRDSDPLLPECFPGPDLL